MQVAGGHHRLVQPTGQGHDAAVQVPEGLLVLHYLLLDEEAVVSHGLDLQHIVELGDFRDLVLVLIAEIGLEQLAGFAGGAEDEPLPLLLQQAFGNPGLLIEGLDVGMGDQLVQVPKARQILHQNQGVVGLLLGVVELAGAIAVEGVQVRHPRSWSMAKKRSRMPAVASASWTAR